MKPRRSCKVARISAYIAPSPELGDGGAAPAGDDELEVPADADPDKPLHLFEGLGCSVTPILDPQPDPRDRRSVRSTFSLVCTDEPGRLAKASRLLYRRYGANIVSSFGGRMDNNIHGSFFTILTSRGQAERIIHDLRAQRFEPIRPGHPRSRDDMRINELMLTAPDRPGIFSEVTDVLARDDHNINVLSHGIITKEFSDSPGLPLAQIELRLEVPLNVAPRLPEVIGEIRDLGRDEGWYIVNREWIGDRGSGWVSPVGPENYN
jgi:hypothetical protein